MNLELPNITFIIVQGILTAYLTFLTAKGGLTDNRNSGHWRKLTKRGKYVFGILFLILVAFCLQEINNNVINDRKDSLLAKERYHRDREITEGIRTGVESSNKKIFDDLSIALKRRDIKLDSLEKIIFEIKDRSKLIVNNYPQPDPILVMTIKGNKQTIDSLFTKSYEVSLQSLKAGSSNFRIKGEILVEYEDNTFEFAKTNYFPIDLKIAEGHEFVHYFHTSTIRKISNIYFHLNGSYSTIDCKKNYRINQLYVYKVQSDLSYLVDNSTRIRIMGIINKYL